MKLTPPETDRPAPMMVFISFAAIYLIWGSTYLAIRVGVETLPPFILAGGRFTIAGVALLGLMSLLGARFPTGRQWRAAAVTGGLMLVGGNGFVVLAEREVPSSIAALIIATTPVWFALGDWIRPGGQRPSNRAWVGIALGIMGVAMLSLNQNSSASPTEVPLKGLGLLVFATISWATGSLLVKHLEKPTSPWMMSGAQMLSGGVMMLGVATVRREWEDLFTREISSRSWASLGYLIVVGSWLGFSAYVWLLKVSTPARVSTYAYVNPVVAVFLGWYLLGEPISSRTLFAAAILLSGVAIVVWPNRSHQVAPLSKST